MPQEKRSATLSRLILIGFVVTCSLMQSPLATSKELSYVEPLKIGDQPAPFKDLKDADGKSHSLSDYKDSEVLIVVFTKMEYGYARGHLTKCNELVKSYSDDKVRCVAIDIMADNDERVAEMKEVVEQEGYEFAYLRDREQETAWSYGAQRLPHFYVLDKDRKIAYMGRFNNESFARGDKRFSKDYVKDAVEALLAGEEPKIKITRANGSIIFWIKKYRQPLEESSQ